MLQICWETYHYWSIHGKFLPLLAFKQVFKLFARKNLVFCTKQDFSALSFPHPSSMVDCFTRYSIYFSLTAISVFFLKDWLRAKEIQANSVIYILTNLHPEISYEAGFGQRQLKVTKKKEKMQSMQAKEVYFYLYLIQLWDHFLILLLVIN